MKMQPNRPTRMVFAVAALSLACVLGATPQVLAFQPAGEPARQPAGRSTEPDFRFGPPTGWVGVRLSKLFVRGESELFDFVRDDLTIGKRDFDGPGISFEIGAPIAPRVDMVFDVGYSRASVNSEVREFVDEFDLPIVQTTRLTQVPLGANFRFLLMPRGREVGRFAWVANSFTPYVGAGVGGLWYRFEQEGEFVDFVDLAIFDDYFESSGWGVSSHLFGGASIKINRWLALATEARYIWSSAELGRDFVGFDELDLAGFKITTGLEFKF
ncbi:MAG: hypothetical protein QF463_02845 [Vicinamibacterales bacterium]|nr:hypothetical protein [Vicinamibacterales bacterium]MDP6607981.1 hypothetical protein [Vicinamibacterales bacterium]